MSNLVIFILVFAVVLIIAGWITAEYMSVTSGKKNKKYEQKLLKVEREKEYIQIQLKAETSRLVKVKEELNSLRDAKDQIRALEREHIKLQAKHQNIVTGVAIIRDKVTHKRYGNNALAKDIVILLNEHCPTEDQLVEQQGQQTQSKFKRIKEGIGG